MPEARHHVEHALWQPGLQRQFGQTQRGERRFFRRLEHHAVARGQRGPQLPRGHQHRVVPRHDGADHADGLARNEGQRVVAGGGDFVVDLVHRFAEPLQAARGGRHVGGQAVLDRLAHVEGFEQREFVARSAQLLGKRHHHLLARSGRLASPAAVIECSAGRGHGAVDVRRLAAGDAGNHLAVNGRDAVEQAAISRGPAPAVDDHAAVDTALEQIVGALMPDAIEVLGHANLLG